MCTSVIEILAASGYRLHIGHRITIRPQCRFSGRRPGVSLFICLLRLSLQSFNPRLCEACVHGVFNLHMR